MSEAKRLHREAMDLAERASEVRALQGQAQALPLFRAALERERAAAQMFEPGSATEPTRSILFRSAGSLALECGEFREAERLAASAFIGDPPDEIADELRGLMEQIHLREALKHRGLVLDSREFQISLLGDSVGTGIASAEDFLLRAVDLEKLIYRTAERKSGRPYRHRGRRARRLSDEVETFVSAPQAGSFSVTFRLGYPQQLDLPSMSFSQAVIDELFACLHLFEQARDDQLRERIADNAYYLNFVALAKEIGPDGSSVRTVGFSRIRDGETDQLLLTRTRIQEAAPHPSVSVALEDSSVLGVRVELRGVLKFASHMKDDAPEIRIVDRVGKRHMVLVPPGMMDDIVRPLWDYEVVVIGRRIGRKLMLDDIRRADEME